MDEYLRKLRAEAELAPPHEAGWMIGAADVLERVEAERRRLAAECRRLEELNTRLAGRNRDLDLELAGANEKLSIAQIGQSG